MRDMRQWDRRGCSGGCGEGECRVKRWVWALAGWWQNGAKWCISTVSWGSKHWFVCFLFQMNLPLKENYDMGSLAQVVILSEHSLPVWVLKNDAPWYHGAFQDLIEDSSSWLSFSVFPYSAVLQRHGRPSYGGSCWFSSTGFTLSTGPPRIPAEARVPGVRCHAGKSTPWTSQAIQTCLLLIAKSQAPWWLSG